jgi:transposase
MSGQITKVYEADTRRRRSEEEKLAIVEESKTVPVARVAKKHGVATSLLFRWRKGLGIRVRGAAPQPSSGFVRLALPACAKPELRFGEGRPAPMEAVGDRCGHGAIEIVLAGGQRVIVGKDVDAAALGRILDVLERRAVGRSLQSEG